MVWKLLDWAKSPIALLLGAGHTQSLGNIDHWIALINNLLYSLEFKLGAYYDFFIVLTRLSFLHNRCLLICGNAIHKINSFDPTRELLLTMFCIAVSAIAVAFNAKIVSTSLPQVIAALDVMDIYAWAGTGYFLTSAITILIYAHLGDLNGHKSLMIISMVLVVVGSVLSGWITQSLEWRAAFLSLWFQHWLALWRRGDIFLGKSRCGTPSCVWIGLGLSIDSDCEAAFAWGWTSDWSR